VTLDPIMKKAKPSRIQLSRQKHFNLQRVSLGFNGLAAVNCSRPSRWGNPFKVHKPAGDPTDMMDPIHGVCFSREAAVGRFIDYLSTRISFQMEIRRELRGKNLACWCPLSEPCHCDVLLRVANGRKFL